MTSPSSIGCTTKLAYQATHDALTGLPNRQLLSEHLHTAQHLTNGGAHSAALFIDLDNLKEVNDTLGHAVGDELLTIAVDRITGCLRHDDLAARLGGNEFAVLPQRPARPHFRRASLRAPRGRSH